MNEQLMKLLASELDSVRNYLEGLIHLLLKKYHRKKLVEIFWHHVFPATKKICQDLGDILKDPFKFLHKDSDLKVWLVDFRPVLNFVQSLCEIGNSSPQVQSVLIRIINILYELAHKIHHELGADAKIHLPRLNLVNVTYRDGVPWYRIDENLLKKIDIDGDKIIYLKETKIIYSDELLLKGQSELKRKNFKKALFYFDKAYNIHPTAKALTFIGWAYSFFGDFSKAKHFCFKAIKHDPEYGNAYNDLGSYYFNEGKFDFATKWFIKAKRAPHHLNRELPYINLGKVYLIQKRYEDALDEFYKAIQIVPYKKDLQKTIVKLEKIIQKQDLKKSESHERFQTRT